VTTINVKSRRGDEMKLISTALLILATNALVFAQDVPKVYADAAAILGKAGDYRDNVFKIGIPRSDLKVSVNGIALPTAFGFAGWIAMTKGSAGDDVLMGDLPLTEAEVNPVMSALLDSGFEVSALHNHFFNMEPMLYFMHVHGHGSPSDLATKIKPALALIGKDSSKYQDRENSEAGPEGHPSTQTALVAGSLDTAALDSIVGTTGVKTGDVYKYTIGRKDLRVEDMGAQINARMGLNTWAAFFGGGNDAVIAGDVAMLPGEVQSVLKTLRSHNVDVVALHHHMIGTDPQIIFLHYWGRGKAADLATTFKAVLDVLGKPSNGMEH
jgi:hypothetical protein